MEPGNQSTGNERGGGSTGAGSAQAGWYAAQGDPPGTLRYWNGTEWIGEPVPGNTVGEPTAVASESPAIEWSTSGLVQASTNYASWGRRVAAFLIDGFLLLPFFAGAIASFAAADQADGASLEAESSLWVVGFLLILATLAVSFINSIIVHGVTGQTVGKRVMKTMLIEESHGNAPGVGRVFARGLLAVIAGNITFSIFTILDLLWPMWDGKNQRIADKVTSTVVVNKTSS